MDRKDGKKKESIDEILSDLNGLLNKMPSILDGIRMPEIKPVEFSKPAPEPEPIKKNMPPAQDADKTIILESLSGLPEGASMPGEKHVQPAQDAGDKTVILEAFSSLPEGAAAPEAEKLVPQSLGDFMFGEGAAEPAPEPAVNPSASQKTEPPVSQSELQPEQPETVLPPSATDLPAAAAAPEKAPEEPAKPAAAPANVHAFESTRDFGIPDIDALMQLSEGDIQALVEPEPQPEPEPAPAPRPDTAEPSVDELAEFEKQMKAAVPQGGTIVDMPEEKKPEAQPAPEAAQVPAAEPEAPEAISPKAEMGFEAFTIEPETRPATEAAQAGEPEGLIIEPSAKAEGGDGLTLDLETRPATEAAGTLQLEQPGAIGAAPQEPAPAAGGIELSIGGQPESAGTPGTQDSSSKAEETLQGMAFEPASAAISGGQDSSSTPFSGDETLVVPPPSGGSGDEERTVIFEAGAVPGIVSGAQAGDLVVLAEKPAPEGIPAERLRSLAFLYSAEDKALCATVLAELDAICLKSATKPMFIKRASVRECAADVNANYVLQAVTDAGAQGLVCVGAIPQEKIYEIENAFSSSGGFFRHYDSASFSHSTALDLVSDLILR
ncbi:MAG TPA: hypothetical protein DCS63_09525 [Elusimicrobia bacterium]|nr:hypothetical protein [Elusimicrobiota bacterium]